jgi:hypothetical protein
MVSDKSFQNLKDGDLCKTKIGFDGLDVGTKIEFRFFNKNGDAIFSPEGEYGMQDMRVFRENEVEVL